MLAGVARGAGVETDVGRLRPPAPADGERARRGAAGAARAARDHEANAEVVEREFRGHDVLYRLRHEGGRTLLVQLPSLELHEVGARVLRAAGAAAVGAAGRLAVGFPP